MAVPSRWSLCRWVTRTAPALDAATWAGSGSPTSGFGRGFAVPAVAELPPYLAACLAQPWRDRLARGDGVLAFNGGRAAARRALPRFGNVCEPSRH